MTEDLMNKTLDDSRLTEQNTR